MMNKQQNPTKAPTHTAYAVQEKVSSDKPVWIKVGALWEHADGEGFNLILNALGQDIKLTIRRNRSKIADQPDA